MNFIKSLYHTIRQRKLSKAKPKMINVIKDKHGKVIHRTRVSNSTFIDSPTNLILGENVYIGHYNFIEASNSIEIQEGCQITSYVSITSHSSHQSIRIYGKNYAGSEMIGYIKGSVKIGKYTFVGPHSVIMPNTQIGKGCIVQAFSYVQGHFPDFSIIGGNPAQIIGDTREKDLSYLEKHPELQKNYDDWTNEI
jgi:acetyltransferase-like isoleucine patch superfamily enzyme